MKTSASIITMTSTYNYGATLQAYALQRFISEMGVSCNLIDHMSDPAPHRKIKFTDISRGNLRKLPFKFSLEKGYRSFETFYEEHMPMTKRYGSVDELSADPPPSEVFIVGSDQVFHPQDPKLPRFLLNFVPADRQCVSYAASMGNPVLPDDKKTLYAEAFRRFHAISVREEEAKAMLQPLTDKPISVNCDPAFLLTAKEWRALEQPIAGLKPGKYVLCYMIHRPPWFKELAQAVKQHTGLPVVFVHLNGYDRIFCDKYIRSAGPKEFLWLIDNADTVISSSFHGNVFSLIFGKKLISTPDQKRPDRIRNLLRTFYQEHCEMRSLDELFVPNSVGENEIEGIASDLRNSAEHYLRAALE